MYFYKLNQVFESSTRIARLAELSEKRIESLIKSLAQREEIGKYLPFEQAFIYSSPENAM